MCGIAGLWTTECASPESLRREVRAMTDAIRYRGPDDSGEWVDAGSGLALGQRRLSVVDLSPAGHQPMVSATGRYVVSFNGEVFNYLDVQREMESETRCPLPLRGHSDTEVMLAAIEHWGLRRAIDRFVGMFAFALWDRHERRLSFVRDRLGVKPLYYAFFGGTVLFGSELKALRPHPSFVRDIDRAALTAYFRFGYVPAPWTIHTAARKLPPGCILDLGRPAPGASRLTRYWSPEEVARRGREHPFDGTLHEAVDELERLLATAVRLRQVADVPVGAFLSGGIDSSTVVSLMQRSSSTPVRTFTIGNEMADYDEAGAAQAVARHLGTDHTALTVTSEEARAVIPELPQMYDEPFADSSQIPTFLVSRLARQQVTVALSGDGGDEVFGGYNRYIWGDSLRRRLRAMPAPVRRGAARLLLAGSPRQWDALFEAGAPLLPPLRNPGTRVHKLARMLDAGSVDELHRRLASLWDAPDALVEGGQERREPLPQLDDDGPATMMLRDMMTYLPDDILTKIDRASMAVSLEARVPLLDHRVVELAWTLPTSLKVRGRTGKWILRQVLARHVPPPLFDRPKTGFTVPIGEWLRGPLRDWAAGLLDEARLRRSGLLRPEAIRNAWTEHLSGARDNAAILWVPLMFEAWREATVL